MNRWIASIVASLCVGLCQSSLADTLLYSSANLAGHAVAAECNPGGGSACVCDAADVSLTAGSNSGTVTSNTHQRSTWVNAIGYKPFFEQFPNNQKIRAGRYSYSYELRLQAIPAPNPAQANNGQAVHQMIQLWDGRNALGVSNRHSIEASVYWVLNPWEADYGKLKVYGPGLSLHDTGLSLMPDLNWHKVSISADFSSGKYTSIQLDDAKVDLSHIELLRVSRPDWGTEVALNITTEAMSTYPGYQCQNTFSYGVDFRGIELRADDLVQ